MTKALIVDQDVGHARQLAGGLRGRGIHVECCASQREAIRTLQSNGEPFKLVLFNLSQNPREVLECLRQLNAADVRFGRPARQILCTAENFLDPNLELDIEACGARVIYER